MASFRFPLPTTCCTLEASTTRFVPGTSNKCNSVSVTGRRCQAKTCSLRNTRSTTRWCSRTRRKSYPPRRRNDLTPSEAISNLSKLSRVLPCPSLLLKLLRHLIVELLGLLHLLCQLVLLLLSVLYQIISPINLVVDQRYSVAQSCPGFLGILLNQHSPHLLQDLHVCIGASLPGGSISISFNTNAFSLSCSWRLFRVCASCCAFLSSWL